MDGCNNNKKISYICHCNFFKLYSILLVVLFVNGCASPALFVANNLARIGEYQRYADIQYGDSNKQTLDVYIPSINTHENDLIRSTVVFFYGGCWGACSDLNKNDYRFVAQSLATNNINVVIVDYRKYPDVLFPTIMEDAAQSVKWVSKNIERYDGDKNRIYLMGHSAGGHIASMLTYNEKYLGSNYYKNIKGFIGLAGPYDFLPFTESYQPTLFAPKESYENSQTVNFVDGNEPAALLMYGNDDTRVKRRNIESLTSIIKSKRGKVKTHYYEGIDHVGLISAFSIPLRSSSSIVKVVISFVNE